MKKVYDFFSGFEGNDEFIIEIRDDKDHIKTNINIWIGYINEIFIHIINNEKDDLKGIPLIYNTEIGGWYEKDDWELIDVIGFLNQLKKIDTEKVSKRSEEVVKVLLKIINLSIKNNNSVYISLK